MAVNLQKGQKVELRKSNGGDFLNVHALEPLHWLICIGISIMVIPLDMIRKAITKAISKQ